MRIPQQLFLLSIVFLCSCVPQRSKTQADLDRLTTSLNDLRGIQAEQVAAIDSIRSELRTVVGRMDVLEHRQSGELSGDISAVKEDISALKNRIPPPAIVPVAALEEDQQRGDLFPDEAGQKFVDGLARIREGKYQAAIGLLEEVLDIAHNSSSAPYALFWLGLAEEGANDNNSAVKHYAELITRFSKHPRAALGLYRQGSVLIRLGDTKAAKFTFKKLIADFPKSIEASKARERLKDL